MAEEKKNLLTREGLAKYEEELKINSRIAVAYDRESKRAI